MQRQRERERERDKYMHGGHENRPSRTVDGLAFVPGVLDPKPPASKQAR